MNIRNAYTLAMTTPENATIAMTIFAWIPGEDRHRDRRVLRRGHGERVRVADVHPRGAQPRRPRGRLARDDGPRRARARAPGARDPRVRVLSADRAGQGRALGDAVDPRRPAGAGRRPAGGGAPVSLVLAQIRAPTFDWPGLSPLLALLGGAT